MKIDLKINFYDSVVKAEIFIGDDIVLSSLVIVRGYVNISRLDKEVVIRNYKTIRKMGRIIQKHYEIEKLLSEISHED